MFHVSEVARILNGPLGSDARSGQNGAFWFAGCLPGRELWCIASDGGGWEHVSVHVANRANKLFMPNWEEMCWIKNTFWDPDDVVMQLHPDEREYVNNHPTTLHLWRPLHETIPTPPRILVGYRAADVLSRR
jgi:hypothetical protein